MRQIEAPGIEIKEIDKSGYAPAMTGTRVYAVGFANKGEAYVPMQFTSRGAWLNYYGNPETEAERYFYNASIETLNQGGVLYCARLPYDNFSFEKVAVAKYKVADNGKVLNIEHRECDLFIDWYIDTVVQPMFLSCVSGVDANIPTDDESTEGAEGVNILKNVFKSQVSNNIISAYWGCLSASIRSRYSDIVGKDVIDEYRECDYQFAMSKDETIDNIYDNSSEPNKTAFDNLLTAANSNLSTFNNYSLYDVLKNQNEYKDDEDKTIIEKLISSYNSTSEGQEYDALEPIINFDGTVSNFIKLEAVGSQYEEISKINEWRSGESKPEAYSFYVVDKTFGQYKKVQEDDRKGVKRELIGIIPFITTAANALYAQKIIDIEASDVPAYESVTGSETIWVSQADADKFGMNTDDQDGDSEIEKNAFRTTDITQQFCSLNAVDVASDQTDLSKLDSLSKTANNFFSSITLTNTGSIDTEHLKKIGVVVARAYLDASQGNKVSFEFVESFIGSLDKDAVNINTGASTFIDTIVNTQSEYIEFYSNYNVKIGANKKNYEEADILYIEPHVAPCLGFYEEMCEKNITSTKSIMLGMQKCFEKVSDINERDIDIVVDAGITNIAQFVKSTGMGNYDPTFSAKEFMDQETGEQLISAKVWKCNADGVKMWKSVANIFLTFCQKTRKDCMFVLDGPRPFCLIGNKKVVRPTKPDTTIDANILPNVKFLTGLNNNYGAMYCDWFEMTDEFTGDLFWVPPSIKATGAMIFTDVNYNYWDAPAGLNRGVVHGVTDVAFSPTNAQAGAIYAKCINYAVNYPSDGIVLEGQRTLQVKPSAFDRINVRRLFLRLERQAYKISRYFLYEGNTAYTRQKLVDTLRPDFDSAKIGGGIYDYKIICDESNNTPDVIDRNELKVSIGIKPVKTAEFILIDFIALSTGASWDEM